MDTTLRNNHDSTQWRQLLGLASLACCLLPATAWGQCETNTMGHIYASDGAADDRFGTSVSANFDGSSVLVGAGDASTPAGAFSGSAYIKTFDGTTWDETKLVASDAQAGDAFGRSVTLGFQIAIVGAPLDDTAAGFNAGSVYVYRFDGTTWNETAHLFAPDATPGDHFGQSIALNGALLVVGAPDHNGEKGSVYVFRFTSSWNLEQQLFPNPLPNLVQYGSSVETLGGLIIVGAPRDGGLAASSRGSAYIYRGTFGNPIWVLEQKLVGIGTSAHDVFGTSVALGGDFIVGQTAIVGAPEDLFSGSGSAYLFRFNGATWNQETILTPSDPSFGLGVDRFGTAVASAREVVIVGAPADETAAGSNAGSAYMYRFNGATWVQETKLVAADGAASDNFGRSVSYSASGAPSGTAVVGAYIDDTSGGSNAGSVYVIPDVLDDCNLNGTIDVCDITSGFSSDVNGNGIPDECEILPNPADCALPPDGVVNVTDLLQVLADWGSPGSCDLDGSGSTDVTDLLTILGAWGP